MHVILYLTEYRNIDIRQVVFLDAHHFPVGFYQPDGRPIGIVHAGLLAIVQRELGPHLADARIFSTSPGTKGTTLQSLLDADRRLVFSYVDNSIVSGNVSLHIHVINHPLLSPIHYIHW